MSIYELIHTDLGADAKAPATKLGRLLQRIDRMDPFNAVGNNGWVLIRDGERIATTQDAWTFEEATKYFLKSMGLRLDWCEHPAGASNHYIADA